MRHVVATLEIAKWYIQHVEEIAKLEVKNKEVLFKIQQASDPEFLRAFATEKLDLAREDELILYLMNKTP